jgi:hypothetical protein
MQAWHSWMSCVTSGVCRLIIWGLLTSKVYLCNCIWKLSEAFILWPFCEGFSQAHGFITRVIFMTVLCTAYDVWVVGSCVWDVLSISYFLWLWAATAQWVWKLAMGRASLGCGVYPPPLSSAEVKEGTGLYLYSLCRPWMPVVGWNLFFTFFFNC